MIKEILTHVWRAPILRILANGPKRYAEVRADLFELKGSTPGDGYISTELRGLRQLGLVERRAVADSRRVTWVLTGLGATAVDVIDEFESPAASRVELPSVDPHSLLDTAAARVGHHNDSVRQSGLAMNDLEARQNKIDTSVPHPARRYNYWLGGKDNFAADRESGDEFERMFPGLRAGVRANRDLLRRAVRYLSGEQGIRQFLDVGTGLPTADNTHEVAQAIAPASRVVYVDNDPLVLTHARALLTSSPEGKTAYIEADLRDPDTILRSPEVAATLDLSQPVALMLVAVLHFVPGVGAAKPIVRHLMDSLAPGSFLVVTHGTADFLPPEIAEAHQKMVEEGRSDIWPRGKEEVSSLFEDLELIRPGIVPNNEWRPEPDAPEVDLKDVAGWTGVGRKL